MPAQVRARTKRKPSPSPTSTPQPPAAQLNGATDFRELVENIPTITYKARVDATGRTFLYISPQLRTLLGYAEANWLAQPAFAWERICEPDRPAVLAALRHSHKMGAPFLAEYRCWTQDDRLIWVRDEAVVTRRQRGGIVVMQGILRNVMERRRAQEQVAQSEARFRALAEAAKEGIVIHRDGMILEVNRAAAEMFGYDHAKVAGLNLFEFTSPESRTTIQAMLAIGFEGVYEITGVRKDGAQIELEVNGRDVVYQGQPARVTILRDRSEDKHKSVTMNRQANEFAVLYELTRQLATQHELKAILNTIVDQATTLMRAGGGSVMLYEAAHEHLVLEAVRGDPALVGTILKLGEGAAGVVAQTRQPLVVPNYMEWAGRSRQALTTRVTSTLQVPMLYSGELIGTLGVVEFEQKPRTFTDSEIRLLTLVAGQAAAVVHNARLLENTRRRLAELDSLNRISRAMRTAQTLEALLPRMLDETLAVFNTEAGVIALVDHTRGDFYHGVMRGWMQMAAVPRLRLNEGIGGHVYATQQAYLISDYATDPHVTADVQARTPKGWGGGCFPIKAGEMLVGFLFIAIKHPRQLQPPEIHLLTALTDIAGNAIHRMRLYAQTELRSRRLAVLHAIDTAVIAGLDLPATLETLLRELTTHLELDAAAILLVDASTRDLVFAAARGFRTSIVTEARVKWGESLAGRAAQEQTILHSDHQLPNAPPFAHILRQAGEMFTSQYAVPLISKGRVLGVLEIFHRTPQLPEADWLTFLELLGAQAAIAIDNAELFEGLQHSNLELTLAYEQTLEGWSRALDLRDRETEGHTQRVTETTVRLAQQMGIEGEALAHIRWGALLHDIGKMGIPDHILLKPGPLTDEEWKIMRLHPGYAYQMLWPIGYLKRALDIPYCHHEKWDGTGYPRGLKGEDIPLAARLFAIVDVWDALRSDRPYRAGWPAERVTAHLQAQAGTHFDPAVVEAFLNLTSNG